MFVIACQCLCRITAISRPQLITHTVRASTYAEFDWMTATERSQRPTMPVDLNIEGVVLCAWSQPPSL